MPNTLILIYVFGFKTKIINAYLNFKLSFFSCPNFFNLDIIIFKLIKRINVINHCLIKIIWKEMGRI